MWRPWFGFWDRITYTGRVVARIMQPRVHWLAVASIFQEPVSSHCRSSITRTKGASSSTSERSRWLSICESAVVVVGGCEEEGFGAGMEGAAHLSLDAGRHLSLRLEIVLITHAFLLDAVLVRKVVADPDYLFHPALRRKVGQKIHIARLLLLLHAREEVLADGYPDPHVGLVVLRRAHDQVWQFERLRDLHGFLRHHALPETSAGFEHGQRSRVHEQQLLEALGEVRPQLPPAGHLAAEKECARG